MALWAKVQTLSGAAVQKVHSLYGDHFPIEVRYILAGWIEEKIMGTAADIDADNPAHEQYISNIVIELIRVLEEKAQAMVNEDPYLSRIKLINAAQHFRQRYTMDPVSLYRFLRHCLTMETQLVENMAVGNNTMGGGQNSSIDESGEIIEKLTQVKQKTMETADILRRMEQDKEAFAIKCHDRQKLEGMIHLHRMRPQPVTPQTQQLEKDFNAQKERLEYELKQRITGLMQLTNELEDKITVTVNVLTVLQSKVLDEELTRWKRDQQLAGNGASLNNNLDTLQAWCEDLAELIWHNRHQLKEAERLKQNIPVLSQPHTPSVDRLASLQEKVTQLLSSLVTSTFIVEKQPPQVMKTNTRFTSTVRLLVGGRLNVHMTPPQVKVAIISEAQANALLGNGKTDKPCETSGEILNNTGTMEYHQGTRHLSVHFRNMQLKRIKRAEKKGTESVMDEKFCLHFQCQFTVGEKELIFKIWTLSLPVVVIVHGNQEPHAWATVTWDNAFGEPGRMPFQVPERVEWFRVAQALNVKFKSINGRSLTEDNLRFLAEKAFRNPNPPDLLTWSQFCKEPLPERSFTFWEWFYAIMKLTREHLRGPWMEGSILGFVGRQQAEEKLSTCSCGTFLLRFSDSELGGVTIAWVHSDQKVFSLAPFTSKDLATRSLADRINDIAHLIYLYPEIPKAGAFSKYYTVLQDIPPTNKGYVKPQLKTHIPGLGDIDPNISGGHPHLVGGYNSQPATPQSTYSAQSPGSVSNPGYNYDQNLTSFSEFDVFNPMDGFPEEMIDTDDYGLSFGIEPFSFPQQSLLTTNLMSGTGGGTVSSAMGGTGHDGAFKIESD